MKTVSVQLTKQFSVQRKTENRWQRTTLWAGQLSFAIYGLPE